MVFILLKFWKRQVSYKIIEIRIISEHPLDFSQNGHDHRKRRSVADNVEQKIQELNPDYMVVGEVIFFTDQKDINATEALDDISGEIIARVKNSLSW